MATETKMNGRAVQLDPVVHRRLKIRAVETDQPLKELASELIARSLDAVENEPTSGSTGGRGRGRKRQG